jgi:uncharacterized damage-inducible protein DinB
MIDPAYVQAMARYNAWQNRSLFGAGDGLDDAARNADGGAFFGSIHATLRHILWGDRIWLGRFTDGSRPDWNFRGPDAAFADWAGLREARRETDAAIDAWANALDPAWLQGDLTWVSGIDKEARTKPKWLCVVHMFNHQTHHRGQVHALLTRAGAKPDASDLAVMPEG